ncbi:DNA methyltransferase [Deinococcus aestuarii]|uniref:DNA methyltransferase n=1 Tax=Deinococcus aestuarii TaxID=2774531 RepID=UPI001C0E5D86|nr:DNA methyltransferase [Deinococcus aestuarii]
MNTMYEPAPKANTASAASSWMRLGPWYAMFPLEFAYEMIQRYTDPGDGVLDPFMGRGTTLAAAQALGRGGLGSEINPVAWVYAATKLHPAPKQAVLQRLQALFNISAALPAGTLPDAPDPLPEFFEWAFHHDVLRFLTVARRELDWRANVVDRTLMALLLVDLHGNAEVSLSNQMRQTKSMGPDYAVAWWKERGLRPQPKDIQTMLRGKIERRYRYGVMPPQPIRTLLGDSTQTLKQLRPRVTTPRYRLLLTSPPYFGLVNYNRDQWIRRWLLGGPWSNSTRGSHKHERDFANADDYRQLLTDIFTVSRRLLTDDATIVVRTDARPFTLQTTREVLQSVYPEWTLQECAQPFGVRTQTHLFGDNTGKPGETDLIFTRSRLASSRAPAAAAPRRAAPVAP